MAIRKRQVTGTFYFNNVTPAAGKQVTIELTDNDYTLDGSIQKEQRKVDLDENGAIPQVDSNHNSAPFYLWCNADGFKGSQYKVTEPDGSVWYFVMEYGDGSPISKDTLRAGGVVVDPSSTINGKIAALITEKVINIENGTDISIYQSWVDELKNYIDSLVLEGVSQSAVKSVNNLLPNYLGNVTLTQTSIIGGIPTYADNAAAVLGGLAVGTIYKTPEGALKVVIV